MATKLDSRQVVLRAQSPFIGNAANEQLDVVFPRIDAEMAKLYEDRNILLTDGGIITWTGTQIQFTENLNLVLNQKISGAAPQVISLGSANVNLTNGQMWYAVINRTAGTAVMAVASTLPAVVAANQEVFLIAKRVDAGDGTQRLYWRNGMALNAGQTVRLGASGSGSGGSGIDNELNNLFFRALWNDPFDDGPTSALSAVNATAGFTDATAYNAAKAMYTLNYDASKTIAAATTTTNINLSAVAAFTVKIGDVVIANNQARRITAVASQSSFTTEAFSVAPTLAAQVTVSQAVYTIDIYNAVVDGNALSAAFPGETFQEILMEYEDTSAAGDNIFDIDIAPVIAWSASPNNATFTDVQKRVTLETDLILSVSLPSAGNALYIRWFALKTSGSGSVNLLAYRTYMQKSANVGTSGGITNSSYAFTNGVGTPINATVSLVGGKTTITLPWQYALGVYAGTTASSIEVWLNGQKLPRFVNSTLTPDGSFLETSSNVVTLDRDYSFQNFAVEIFQRTQIVDNSTTNTTNISYLQESMQNGFQGFINQNQLMNATANAGAPVAGTFYSSIIGRASMIDLSQDLRARMGVDRLMTQSLSQLQNEFGPNGEPVFSTHNDQFGQVRYVGGWINLNDVAGLKAAASTSTTDYAEVTFYGTGINLLGYLNAALFDVRITVNGGSESATILPPGSTVINNRNYSVNTVIPAISGLTLGVHTVKFRSAHASNGANFYGFEILNESNLVKTNPGIGYINGQKYVSTSQSAIAYNANVTGTRGGRIVQYLNNNGTIEQSFRAAGSQLNLTSADHTNEEVVRTYNFREFGAGRTDDFSRLSAAQAAAFTLDDGTTTLVTSNGGTNTSGSLEGLGISGNGNFHTITFVGTGLDIYRFDTGTGGSDTFNVLVDGTSIGNLATAGSTTPRFTKIVSGLPYGTHTVKISRTSAATWTFVAVNFIVYQPKKPALPSGAIELADYNVVADFVANASSGPSTDFIATGVVRKSCIREMTYVGTFSAVQNAAISGGWYVASSTSGSYVQYTFFGTGFDFRFDSNNGTNLTVNIDGSTNLSSFTTSLYGGTGTFTAATGVIATTSAVNNSGARVSGLALGLHTVRVTWNASVGTDVCGFDIITPIHSVKSNIYADLQNTLPVGSQGISDNRKTTPVTNFTAQKAWVQAIGITASPTTTSTSFVPMPDMSVTIKTANGAIYIDADTTHQNSVTNGINTIAIYVDGVNVWSGAATNNPVPGTPTPLHTAFVLPISAGVHKVDIFWLVNTGTGTANGANRRLTVREI